MIAKRVFVTGPKIYVTFQELADVPGCGPRTTIAIWERLPYKSMEDVLAHLVEEPRLGRLVCILREIVEGKGSKPMEHYQQVYDNLQRALDLVRQIPKYRSVAKYRKYEIDVLQQLARNESHLA